MTRIGLARSGTPVSETETRTQYLISRRRNGAPGPLRVGREPDTALPVSGSRHAALRYLSSSGLEPGWHVRASSGGELASILSGLCRGVGTVLLDPLPESSSTPSGIPRSRFLELLLENRGTLRTAAPVA